MSPSFPSVILLFIFCLVYRTSLGESVDINNIYSQFDEDALLADIFGSYEYSYPQYSFDMFSTEVYNKWNLNSHTEEQSYSYDYYSGRYDGNQTSSPTSMVSLSDPTACPSAQPSRPTFNPTFEDGFAVETFLPYYTVFNAQNRIHFSTSLSLFEGVLLVGSPPGYDGSDVGYVDLYDVATLQTTNYTGV